MIKQKKKSDVSGLIRKEPYMMLKLITEMK